MSVDPMRVGSFYDLITMRVGSFYDLINMQPSKVLRVVY